MCSTLYVVCCMIRVQIKEKKNLMGNNGMRRIKAKTQIQPGNLISGFKAHGELGKYVQTGFWYPAHWSGMTSKRLDAELIGTVLTGVWHSFPFWALGTGQVCAVATSWGLNSHPSVAVDKQKVLNPSGKQRYGEFYYFQFTLRRLQFNVVSSSLFQGQKRLVVCPFFFFFMDLFPPSVYCWRMELFTFPEPLQTASWIFLSLLSFLPALNLCPYKALSPVSYLKVMSSDLAGAEENVPNS